MTSPAVAAEIERAVSVLRRGGLVAFPTDTLYALGADALSDAAVDRVVEIKGREAGKPLPLFVDGLEMAETVAVFSDAARRLARRFWPGALTLVLPRQPSFVSKALVGGETVALRVPKHDVALAIVRLLGRPVTGTSANLAGGDNPSTPDEVRRQIGANVDFVLDGGRCPVSLPSTIVSWDDVGEVLVLRQGALDEESVRRALED